ncbi:hypothetical protein Tco_0452449 [Tanacetum coccineum]
MRLLLSLSSCDLCPCLRCSLDRLFCLAILCLDQHAHTLHHLESLLTISLDNHCLDNLEHEHEGFTAALAILVTRASQSRQHGKSESDSYFLSD